MTPTFGDRLYRFTLSVDQLDTINFNDIIAFLTAFSNGDPSADLAEPFGILNFNDVVAYLSAFAAGCP